MIKKNANKLFLSKIGSINYCLVFMFCMDKFATVNHFARIFICIHLKFLLNKSKIALDCNIALFQIAYLTLIRRVSQLTTDI